MLRSEAIANFLRAKTHPDLAELYRPEMEVQVNVAQDGGERVNNQNEADYKGRQWLSWTDGVTNWFSFRMPKNAKTVPEGNDFPIKFDIAAHAEGIGMTGWDWKNKVSRWVAFDFDAIAGHAKGLTSEELQDVQETACQIPWVTVRKSTSGKGLHLYVFLDPVTTENHTEHAALGRAILGSMAALTGFDFSTKVDNCGGNMWVWHRKMEGTDGLTVIKRGEILESIPLNWQDHVAVISGKRRRTLPTFIPETESDSFEEMVGQRARVTLDQSHKLLISFLEKSGGNYWWDQDHGLLVCHTYDLKLAHKELMLRGIFDTVATGRERPDHNCFAIPISSPTGAWIVRRFTPGVQETSNWDQDSGGWTKCFYNQEPTLDVAARTFGGIEHEKSGFCFTEAETVMLAAKALGAIFDLPAWARARQASMRQHKDGRLIVHIKREGTDNASDMPGWLEDKGQWKRIFNVKLPQKRELDLGNYDEVTRHLITEGAEDCGWVVRSGDSWKTEPLQHVRVALKAIGLNDLEGVHVQGTCVINPWMVVNKPFQPEYPGNRQWNRHGAQLKIKPTQETDNLSFPTWARILKHCGSGLDYAIKNNGWCNVHGITSGADYLKIWIASLFREPNQPLPYLFFYGPQNSGKSIFHEALGRLMTKGYVRADNALMSPSGFNGELNGAVLCVIEETSFKKHDAAYNRIKDWVTARMLPIRALYQTAYSIENTSHWIQCSNNQDALPILPGDTRITMLFVPSLDPLELIPKKQIEILLDKESPDFLAEILSVEIPPSYDRLNVPVITTDDKIQTEQMNRTVLEQFVEENTYWAPGQKIKFTEFFDRFIEWLDPSEIHSWSKIRVGRELPTKFVKGRSMQDGAQFFVGNISWTPPKDTGAKKYFLDKDRLVLE